jgi:hypothetical protein
VLSRQLITSHEAKIKYPDFVRKQSDSVRKLAVFVRELAHSVRRRFIVKIAWRSYWSGLEGDLGFRFSRFCSALTLLRRS